MYCLIFILACFSSSHKSAPVQETFFTCHPRGNTVAFNRFSVSLSVSMQFADQSLMKNAIKTSEESWIEQQMLEDKKRATDWEATNEAIEEQVARESYLQWLRDQEKQARQVWDLPVLILILLTT